MKILYDYFKLFRGANLLIIALSLFFFQYCIIRPVFENTSVYATLSHFDFVLLTLAIVLIAAAGNLVNDYFDFEMDKEYKAESSLLGTLMSLDTAYTVQFAMNAIGVGLGFFLGWKVGNTKLGYLFVFAMAFLWLYSMTLKKYFLIGNIVVAALSAFVFVVLVMFESKIFTVMKAPGVDRAAEVIMIQLQGYAAFAFLVSLIREIVKDAEDKEGDAAYKMTTLPVVLPIWATNLVIALLLLLLMVGIGFVQTIYWNGGAKNQFWYATFFLQVSLLLNLVLIFASKTQKDYRNLSVQLKLLMLFGILTMPVFYFFNK